MQEPQRFDKVAGCCWRLSAAAVILGFLMVPAAIALRFWGLSGGLAVLGGEVAVACLAVLARLKDSGTALAEFLTTRGGTGAGAPPLLLAVAGIAFWGPGLYAILSAAEAADPQPDQFNAIEQTWFGTTVLLMGAGVSGLGVSGWLARRARDRRIARLTDEIRDQPQNDEHHFNRGLLLLERGRIEQAIEDFSEAIRIAPDTADAYLQRAHAHYSLNHYQQAIADFSTVIELDPENIEAYVERASVYIDNDQPERAEADFARVEQLDPQGPK